MENDLYFKSMASSFKKILEGVKDFTFDINQLTNLKDIPEDKRKELIEAQSKLNSALPELEKSINKLNSLKSR